MPKRGGHLAVKTRWRERRLVRSSVGLTSCWWWARQVSLAMEQYLRRRPEGEPVLRGGGLRLR